MAKSKYAPTPEEQAKLGLESQEAQEVTQEANTEEAQKVTQDDAQEAVQEETFPSWVTDEQKEMLADYFERHPFQKHFWLTESNHLFYEECDLLSAFREPTSIKYAKILREWVK